MEFSKVTLTFESEDKMLWMDHSNTISLPVLSHGALCFAICLSDFAFGHIWQ